jgi:hypothetical protein
MQLIHLSTASTSIVCGTSRPSENTRSSGWLSRVFGCWHMELSWLFSSKGQTYGLSCRCNASAINPRSWKMQGKFYYNKPKGAHSIRAI